MSKNETDLKVLQPQQTDDYADTVYAQLDMKKEVMDSNKRIFMLIAGVGAGKNYWVKKLSEAGDVAKGYAEHGYKVLLITSRVATVEAQTIELNADKNFHFWNLYEQDPEWGTRPRGQKVVCCTNSYIEFYAKHLYDPKNARTHVWNMFDFIILDEVHSMACDATFSEAPFYVRSFLQYAYRNSSKCRIVMMSGTPKPVAWLYKTEDCKEHVHTIDLYDKCRHVEPKKVWFYPKINMAANIAYELKKGERIVYFATQTDHMKQLITELHEQGIPNEWIGISYSDDPEKDKKFDEALVRKRRCIAKYLAKYKGIPEHVRILITTSKYKEGINIEDTDIKTMIIESHHRDEVIQMAGRVRKGLERLLILYDAPQHSSTYDPDICALSFASCTSANKILENKRTKATFDLQKFIPKIVKQLPYVRYNPFTEQFEKYYGSAVGHRLTARAEHDFQAYIDLWRSPLDYDRYIGEDFFQKWFPSAKFTLYEAPFLDETVRAYIRTHKLLDRVFSLEERDALVAMIMDSIKTHEQNPERLITSDMKSPGPIMKKLKYTLKKAKGVRNGEGFKLVHM